MNDETARILSDHPTITDLELKGGRISSKGAEFFRENKIIKKLNLSSNPLGDEGACILSTLSLSSLSLWGCGIGDKGATVLAGNPYLLVQRQSYFDYFITERYPIRSNGYNQGEDSDGKEVCRKTDSRRTRRVE